MATKAKDATSTKAMSAAVKGNVQIAKLGSADQVLDTAVLDLDTPPAKASTVLPMKQVRKFALQDFEGISMSVGAQLLSVHEQRGGFYLWALVDMNAETEQRQFIIVGTNQDIVDMPLAFVGTAYTNNGAMAFHVFEVLTEKAQAA